MTKTPYAPVLCSQSDVLQFWVRICRPLGWARRDLWFCVIGGDGRPTPMMTQVEDLPEDPDSAAVGNLGWIWRRLLDDHEPGGRVAGLLCRPGAGGSQPADRAWGRAIVGAAQEHGAPIEVLHVACDQLIFPLPMDELDRA